MDAFLCYLFIAFNIAARYLLLSVFLTHEEELTGLSNFPKITPTRVHIVTVNFGLDPR